MAYADGRFRSRSRFSVLMLSALTLLILSPLNVNSSNEVGCTITPFKHSNLFDNQPDVTSFNYDNKVLNCSGMSIKTLNRDYLNNIVYIDTAFKQIILTHMLNDGPSDGNFLNVINEPQTEMLSIVDSELSDMQLRAIFHKKNYSRLKYLDVASNKIQSIDSSTFGQIVRLRELNLARNTIRHLDGEVFRELDELRRLNLSGNQLSELNRSPEVFNNLRQLRVLDLSDNTINDIPRHIFYGLGSLIELNISQNKLYLLPFQAFESMTLVEVIDLSYNLLVSFLDNFFLHNMRLKVLQLHHNNLRVINKNSLYGLKELHTLDLSHNQIKHVDRNAFDTLDGLRYLHLENNQIEELASIVFLSLKQLVTLNLSNNPILQLPLGIFANQYKLNTLHMDNTRIKRLSNWINSASNATINKNILQNLNEVSLRNSTNLKSVESCFFYNLPNIKRLFITNSELTFLPKGIEEMSQINELDLSNNHLEFIPEGLKHLINLNVLNLLNNDFLCDCHMFWMLGWLDELKAKNMTLPYDLLRLSELKCRNGYPGDIIRVLRHINCVKPYLIFATSDQEYQVFTDAVLECSFAGTPAPEIIWRTPHGIILRHNENHEYDPGAKFQLDQHHRSVLEDTLANYQPLKAERSELKIESLSERLRQGPGITLLENGFLKVHNISRTDAGLYSCFAVNIMGNATTDIR